MSLSLILAKMRGWEAERHADGTRAEAIRRHLADTLQPLLGKQATERILLSVASDDSQLLCTVEDALSTFLGAKAAAAVVTNAVDRGFVRS